MDTTLVKLYANLSNIIENRIQELDKEYLGSTLATLETVSMEHKQRLSELSFIRKQITKVFSEIV